jgi:hypothetical protein
MFDSIDIPGYAFKSKHRKNVARMRSGGILLGFRENLVNHVQILENECEFVLWFKIDGKVFNLEQPVIFGTIYIPPEYTRYSSDEAFNKMEHELHSVSTNSKYVGLIGDFNSRTGEDDDYVNVNFEHGDNSIDEFIVLVF